MQRASEKVQVLFSGVSAKLHKKLSSSRTTEPREGKFQAGKNRRAR